MADCAVGRANRKWLTRTNAIRMADCAVGRNREKHTAKQIVRATREKKKQKKKEAKKKKKKKKNTLDSELQIDIQSLELGVREF